MEMVPPLTYSVAILQILGLPGLIFIIWYFDNKRFQRQEDSRKAEQQVILDQYRAKAIPAWWMTAPRRFAGWTASMCRWLTWFP